MNNIKVLLLIGFMMSCTVTQFVGKPHLTPLMCKKKCNSWGMTLDAMVAMGEYSDACVCRPRRKKVRRSSKKVSSIANPVGVIFQMRAAEEKRRKERMKTTNNAANGRIYSPYN